LAHDNDNLHHTLIQIQALEDFNEVKEDECAELSAYIKVMEEYVYTTKTDLKGIITDVSKSFCRLSGYAKEELIGQNHNIVRNPMAPKNVFSTMWKTISNRGIWEGELNDRKKDGDLFWMQTIIFPRFDKEKNILGYTAIRQNITAGKRLEHEVIRDPLTGLFNRRFYNEIIERELLRTKRDKTYITFIMLDIDYFKLYNDTYGHKRGDEALKKVATTLKSILNRGSDYIFRMGGEEFSILFTELGSSESKKMAEHICKSIEDLKIEHSKSTCSKYLTVSLGALTVNMGHDIVDETALYTLADSALYKAKESGRNKVFIHKKNDLELF